MHLFLTHFLQHVLLANFDSLKKLLSDPFRTAMYGLFCGSLVSRVEEGLFYVLYIEQDCAQQSMVSGAEVIESF